MSKKEKNVTFATKQHFDDNFLELYGNVERQINYLRSQGYFSSHIDIDDLKQMILEKLVRSWRCVPVSRGQSSYINRAIFSVFNSSLKIYYNQIVIDPTEIRIEMTENKSEKIISTLNHLVGEKPSYDYDAIAMLYTIIDRYNPIERLVIIAGIYEFTVKETVVLTGLSEGQVKWIKRKFRECVKDDPELCAYFGKEKVSA